MTVRLGSRGDFVLLGALLAFCMALTFPADLPGWFGPPEFAWASWCYVFAVPVLAVALASGRRLNSALLWPMAAYVSWIAFSAMFGVEPRHSFQQLAMLLGIVSAAFAAAWVMSLDRRATMWGLGALVLMCTVLQVLAFMHHVEMGLAQRITGYLLPEGWGGYPELALLVMVQFVVVLATLLHVRRRMHQVALASLLGVTALEATLLYARVAWVSIVVVAVCLPFLLGSLRRAVASLFATVALVMVVGGATAVTNPSFRRLASAALSAEFGGAGQVEGVTLNVADLSRRTAIWRDAWRMARDEWTWGVGLGNFRDVFESRYRPDVADDGRRAGHAHNAFIQQACELGLLGGLLYVWAWTLALTSGWRRTRSNGTFADVTLLGCAAGMFMQSLGDYYSFTLSGARGRLTTLIWMVLALLTVTRNRIGAERRSTSGANLEGVRS